MKTTKLVIGIVSMVLFLLISLQSCAAGVGSALSKNGSNGASMGIGLAFFLLVAGIIAVAGRKSKIASFVAGIFYLIAAICGFAGDSYYGDLKIWAGLSLIFAIVFVLMGILQKKVQKTDSTAKTE